MSGRQLPRPCLAHALSGLYTPPELPQTLRGGGSPQGRRGLSGCRHKGSAAPSPRHWGHRGDPALRGWMRLLAAAGPPSARSRRRQRARSRANPPEPAAPPARPPLPSPLTAPGGAAFTGAARSRPEAQGRALPPAPGRAGSAPSAGISPQRPDLTPARQEPPGARRAALPSHRPPGAEQRRRERSWRRRRRWRRRSRSAPAHLQGEGGRLVAHVAADDVALDGEHPALGLHGCAARACPRRAGPGRGGGAGSRSGGRSAGGV